MSFLDFLQSLFKQEKPKPQINNAYYWNNRWKHNKVIYKAQKNIKRDVRTYIFDYSYLLEDISKRFKGSHDQKALQILKWVIRNIRYKGDKEVHNQREYWQNPEETLNRKTGDCEDGALLVKSLALVSGIPDYKIKICAGNVKGGGHAYVIYLRERKKNKENSTWCILDWCYWPNYLPIARRKEHKDEENYYDIWWTFNKEFTFAQKKAEYSKGKNK